MQEGSPKKSAFSIERHYNVGSKMTKIDVFEVRYLENDNGDPPPLFFSYARLKNSRIMLYPLASVRPSVNFIVSG